MPRRVKLTILLGLVTVIVLSFGLSAGAQPGDDVGAEEDPFSALEQKQRAADIAHAEHQNAVFEENQVNREIAGTRQDLAGTEQQLAEAENELGHRASQMYKENDNLRMIDALLGARSLSEFTQVSELLLRQIDNDQKEVRQLSEYRDTLQQQEEELNSQVEDRGRILEETSAKKEEADRAKSEAQEFVDSLSPDEQEDIEQEQAERAQEAAETIRGLLVAQEGDPSAGESEDEASVDQEEQLTEDSNETPREEGQDAEAGETSGDQTPPMTEEDEQRRGLVVQAVDEVLSELAQGGLPKKEGTDGPVDQGTSSQNLLAGLTADTAKKEEEANLKASETAERVAAEQEAQKKAAEQAEAAESAKRAAQEAPEQQRSELQAAADEVQRQADLAAKEAAEMKAAAEESANQTAAERQAADQAATRLAEERTARPLAGELPLAPIPGLAEGQLGALPAAGELPSAPFIGTNGVKPAPSGLGGAVLDQADNLLGVPYVSGGNTPTTGLDCSAFTKWVYGKLGIPLTDSPAGQMGQGRPVSRSELRPGDLVFFDETGGKGPPTHVGIYMGNNQLIHSSNYTMDVTVTNMNYIKGFLRGSTFW